VQLYPVLVLIACSVCVRTLGLCESAEEFRLSFTVAPNSAAKSHRKPASPGISTDRCGAPDSHKRNALWQENGHLYALRNLKACTLHQVLLGWSIKKVEIDWASSTRTRRNIKNLNLKNCRVETDNLGIYL